MDPSRVLLLPADPLTPALGPGVRPAKRCPQPVSSIATRTMPTQVTRIAPNAAIAVRVRARATEPLRNCPRVMWLPFGCRTLKYGSSKRPFGSSG
ncbi:hypothetical protein GCM10010988_20090 [Cnuibacter physcomitrellae]|nr:hypothetical protein GCM10010988_20090 [Cnuibacter physcomitrellae]